MAIKMMQGFDIRSTNPIDKRIVMTKAEMLAANPNLFPDLYFAWCSDDGALYVYDKNSTTTSTETGKFVKYEERIDLPGAIQKAMTSEAGKAAMEEAVATTLPGAMKDVLEDETLGPQLVNNMFDSEHFELNLDNKIDIAISVIEAIDGN